MTTLKKKYEVLLGELIDHKEYVDWLHTTGKNTNGYYDKLSGGYLIYEVVKESGWFFYRTSVCGVLAENHYMPTDYRIACKEMVRFWNRGKKR